MPTEVLSYYLKNKDRKVRLGFQVILQCAPFLKGLKVSGLISMEMNHILNWKKCFPGWRSIFINYPAQRGNALSFSIAPKSWKNI